MVSLNSFDPAMTTSDELTDLPDGIVIQDDDGNLYIKDFARWSRLEPAGTPMTSAELVEDNLGDSLFKALVPADAAHYAALDARRYLRHLTRTLDSVADRMKRWSAGEIMTETIFSSHDDVTGDVETLGRYRYVITLGRDLQSDDAILLSDVDDPRLRPVGLFFVPNTRYADGSRQAIMRGDGYHKIGAIKPDASYMRFVSVVNDGEED